MIQIYFEYNNDNIISCPSKFMRFLHNNKIPEGFYEKFHSWMCLPDLEILTFSILILTDFPPINIPIFLKTSNIAQSGCFLAHFFQITPN